MESKQKSPQKWARPKELARIFGIKESWLENDRWKGGKDAIPFTKVRGLVLYHIPTVEKWFEDRVASSTSEEL